LVTDESKPAAQGTLQERPLARLLQQLFRKKVTGALVLDDRGEVSRVYLRDGYPVHVERPSEVDRLDRVLIDCGVLSAEVVQAAQEQSTRSGRRLGEVLAEEGALPAEALADVLKAQLKRKLTRLFALRAGTFQVFVQPHEYGAGPDFPAMRVDPRCLVLPGLRLTYDESRLNAELAPLTGFTFRLIDLPTAYLTALGFGEADAVIETLRARPLTLADLDGVTARTEVLALLYTDLLEAQPLTAAPSLPNAPPGSPRSAHPLRAAVLARAETLDRASHFELLDLPETAPLEQVGAAFVKAARQFHPDRLAAAGLSDLAPIAERIMARLSEASAVLSDPARRAAYLAERSGQGTSNASLARTILDAEQAFRRGEQLLKNGDHARAIEAFSEAAKARPEEAQYRAYLAWARFDDPRAAKASLARGTLDVLEAVLREQPGFAWGHFFVGQVCKQQGDLGRAEAAFREALARDATLLDAERELRLIDIRRAKGARPAASPSSGPARQGRGLLGKLFRRDG
jgi:tetratricopeptide (TPR) repeat protein